MIFFSVPRSARFDHSLAFGVLAIGFFPVEGARTPYGALTRCGSIFGQMDANDDLTSQILNSLNELSAEDQAEVILAVISAALKVMSVYRILEIRGEIVDELNSGVPLVRSALELIDGQLMLREIAGDEEWR